jgi:3-hydroxybutyryl-CoA dehydratase
LHSKTSWFIISTLFPTKNPPCFNDLLNADPYLPMNRPALPKRMIGGAPSLGDKVAFTRTLTEADVALFIGTTWDVNPLHTDEIYCRGTQFMRRIVPGLLTASLLTHLGGLWAFLATEMDFKFVSPVYVGDSITADAEVVEINSQTGEVCLQCRCTNQDGKVVLTSKIRGYPGKFA